MAAATALEAFLTTGLDQEDELRCDMIGVYLAFAANYDPAAGLRFWEMNDDVHAADRTLLEKLGNSHPDTRRRQHCLFAYLTRAKERATEVNELAQARFREKWARFEGEMAHYKIEEKAYLRAREPKSWVDMIGNQTLAGLALLAFGALFLDRYNNKQKKMYLMLGVFFIFTGLVVLISNISMPSAKGRATILNPESPEVEYTGFRAEVTSYGLNLRREPTSNSEIIHPLVRGSVVRFIAYGPQDKIRGKSARWCKVEDEQGQIGWIWEACIRLIDPVSTPTPVGYRPKKNGGG